MARRPNIRSAAADLVFAAVAFVQGLMGAPIATVGIAFAGGVLLWAWTRREALARMSWPMRVTNSALALGMLAVVLGVLHWIGLTFGGHT